jgi:hypothetical protein
MRVLLIGLRAYPQGLKPHSFSLDAALKRRSSTVVPSFSLCNTREVS